MVKKYMVYAVIFLLGAGAAWVLAPRQAGSAAPTAPAAPAAPQKLTRAALEPFVRAVGDADYDAMAGLGARLFAPGAELGDGAALLEPWLLESLPPHKVYALYTRLGGTASRRVLLTTDMDGAVVSFMAEEIPVEP